MNLLEHFGKALLHDGGIATPQGTTAATPQDCAVAAAKLGPRVVLKCQVPAGKRGKSGGIRFASSPAQARAEAGELLGSIVGGFKVKELLVEQCVDIARELYAAVLNDPVSKGPLLVFSTDGGMDIEEVNNTSPEKVLRAPIDIRHGLGTAAAAKLLAETDLTERQRDCVADVLVRLYDLYRTVDAEQVEINPLVLTKEDAVVAVDAKISLDPGARPRHTDTIRGLVAQLPDTATELEHEARELGLALIEFDGSVGVLANGAGLTMTTLDAVNHYGGKPANFLEIGGDAYTKATPALRLVLANPQVRSLVVNFCGAFARTDVMAEGVINAIEELQPSIPIFFCIHGTGEEEAIRLVRERLQIEPYDLMDDAVKAAVAAAGQEVPDVGDGQ
jgi:succinyl-CoA synthetase beta subunit